MGGIARKWWVIAWAAGVVGCQADAEPSDGDVTPAATLAAERLFSLPDRELLPENVAHDPRTGAWFVGSTRRGSITRVLDGEVSTFVAPRAHGLWMVIGMKADPERRALWVCSSDGGNLAGGSDGSGNAGLFRFDLDTGELLDRWTLEDEGERHFLNDLVVDPDGNAWVTHMFDRPALYRARAGGELERWMDLPAETWPNGVTSAPDGTSLYVAVADGIARIDSAERSFTLLPAAEGVPATGVDGLYLHGDALIGIRPGAMEVRRYRLSPEGDRIVASDPVVAEHPDHAGPTTGVLVEDALVYVANAQFQLFDAEGADALVEPVVLRVPLR